MGRRAGSELASPGLSGPLKLHLSVLIILLLLITSGPLIWLSYERGQDAAIADAGRQMTALTGRTMDRYGLLFADVVPVLNMLSATEATASASPDTVSMRQSLLLTALADAPSLDGIYCAYPDKSFIHLVRLQEGGVWRQTLAAPAAAAYAFRTITVGPAARTSSWAFLDSGGQIIAHAAETVATYDPHERNWYKLASTVPGIVADGPYVTATTKSLALTVAKAHAEDSRIVIGADIMLDTIGQFLKVERVSPNGRAFVLDAQGNVLIATDAPPDGSRDPLLDKARDALARSLGSIEFIETGTPPEQYLLIASRIESSPLLQGNVLVIAAPLRDFTAENERLLQRGLGLSLVLLFLGLAAAIGLSRFITRPLSKLTTDAASLGDLETAARPPSASYVTEINLLSSSLAVARDAIRNFALYVPKELVRKIVATKGTAALGERLEVTVLFTDIRDFTTISENNSPEDVVAWLSAYFELINETIEEHHGTIIQFLGDSVYAMWNAPLPDKSHIEHACHCALEVARRIDAFNAGQRQSENPPLVTRFGIHTGQAVVGNIGAKNRLQYTAMGDTINVASRLEGINKEFGTTIMTSRAVYESAQTVFDFRPWGFHHAKGREEPVEIFELVATRPVGCASPDNQGGHTAGLHLF